MDATDTAADTAVASPGDTRPLRGTAPDETVDALDDLTARLGVPVRVVAGDTGGHGARMIPGDPPTVRLDWSCLDDPDLAAAWAAHEIAHVALADEAPPLGMPPVGLTFALFGAIAAAALLLPAVSWADTAIFAVVIAPLIFLRITLWRRHETACDRWAATHAPETVPTLLGDYPPPLPSTAPLRQRLRHRLRTAVSTHPEDRGHLLDLAPPSPPR